MAERRVLPAEPGLRNELASTVGHVASVPMINNLHMAHGWTEEGPGGVCRRCGAEWPEKDSCP